MIKTTLNFQLEDIKQMLENIGLEVQFKEQEFSIPCCHNQIRTEILSVWVVINPHTGTPELLEEFSHRWLESVKKKLFLSIDSKLEVYNLFERK